MNLAERASRFAALGDPARLAMVEDLAGSDWSPHELAERHGLPSNLLAHHLSVLEQAGMIERLRSSGDRRRRYVRLRHSALAEVEVGVRLPDGPVLFVCTHNSARSQLAAALWSRQVGTEAGSAGTHPAKRVHPEAVTAANRAGLDLTTAQPRLLSEVEFEPSLVVTVCDRAHEELEPEPGWWHWSIPDPVEDPAPGAFDAALERLRIRIKTLTKGNDGG